MLYLLGTSLRSLSQSLKIVATTPPQIDVKKTGELRLLPST